MDTDAQELRERILDAAIEAFNDQGARFTLADISKSLNISKKTIYTVFESKEHLLNEMIESGFKSIKDHERLVLEDESLTIVEKIKKIIIIIPEKYHNVDFKKIATIKEKYPKLYKRIEAHIESEWEPTIELLEEGMMAGAIRRVPIPILKTIIEASMERILERDLMEHPDYNYVQVLEEMMDILMEGIKTNKGDCL